MPALAGDYHPGALEFGIDIRQKGNLAALSLQRAKAIPLKLWLDSEQIERSPGLPGLIIPHIQNIQTLHFLMFRTTESLQRTLPDFPRSTPNLQSLALHMIGNDVVDRFADPLESLTPTLRSLSLTDVHLYPSFLRLRALTELTLSHNRLDLRLDALLDFLEGNDSLKSVTLAIRFTESSLLSPQRGAATMNQLQHLSIYAPGPVAGKALISNIALRRGAHMKFFSYTHEGSNDISSGIHNAQLSNLMSLVFMEYQTLGNERGIRLLGRNGSLSFRHLDRSGRFLEFPLLPLTNIREVRLVLGWTDRGDVFNSSFFPALEVLAVTSETWVSNPLSTLFTNPSSPPRLRTLAFASCQLSRTFMEGLTRYASDRKNTASVWLRHVVIVDSREIIPTEASIKALEEHVSVVDVRVGKEIPRDLA